MTASTSEPVLALNDGAIRATVLKTTGSALPEYTTRLTRADGSPLGTLSCSDIVAFARLAELIHREVLCMRQLDEYVIYHT